MKKLILFSLLLGGISVAKAQTGISATGTAPDASAMLDVIATDKGFLAPRVALTSTASSSPVTAPATGLMVFNTNAVSDVTVGYYYWDGSAWKRLLSGASNLSGAGTPDYLARWITAGTLGIGATRDNGTNVGIGAAPGTVKLKVSGDIEADNQIRARGWLAGTGNGQAAEIGVSGGYSYFFGYDRTAGAYTPTRLVGSTIDLRHSDSNSDLFIKTDGNVGINNNAPAVRLHVTGNAYFDLPAGGASLENNFTIKKTGQAQVAFGTYPGAWTPALLIQNNDNTRYVWISPLDNASGGNSRLVTGGSSFDMYPANVHSATFHTSGNVGIGATTPLGRLDIRVAGGNGAGKIYTGGDNSYPRIYMGGSSAAVAFVINRETAAATMYFGEDADAGGFQFRGAGGTRISSLSGSGTRLVQTDAGGNLSTTATLVGTGLGDNLGNHAATTTLDMNNNIVSEVNYMELNNGFRWSQGSSNYGIFNSWLQSNGNHGIYWPSASGFASAPHLYPGGMGDYGSLRIEGRRNSWSGLSLEGRYVLMTEGDNEVGLYNDVDNEWMIYGVQNGGVYDYYDGSWRTQTTAGGVLINGNLQRTDHANGFLEGSYNNIAANDARTNPIYTIGSAYNPTNTSLSNMYGIGYTHSNFWGGGANMPGGWGQYVAADGDIRIILEASNGRIWASGDVRSPIYYDQNDMGYYVDPASGSVLHGVVTIEDNGSASPLLDIRADDTGPWAIRLYNDSWGTGPQIYASATDQIYTSGYWRGGTGLCIGSDCRTAWPAGGADNLGNHTATTYLQMGAQWINFNSGGGIYSSGYGNHFWPVDQYYWYMRSDRGMRIFNNAGTSRGYLYHNDGGSFGLLSEDGSWKVRVDNGAIELYNTTYAPFIYDRDNTGYYLDPNGSSQMSLVYANNWFRGQGSTGLYFQDYGGGWHMTDGTWIRSYNSKNVYCDVTIRADAGFQVDGNQVIDGDAGWHRTYGSTGWYNSTYAGGWYMADATWIRNYNAKQLYYDTNAGDNTDGIRLDMESNTQDHALASESDAYGFVGYSNRRWYVMYAWAGFGTSSLKYKTDVSYLGYDDMDTYLDKVNNIESIKYKWNKDVWEKQNGNFADAKSHEPGEKPDPDQEIQEWLGFAAESLPEECLDETGENFQYGSMIGLLVASTKALTKRTEVLADALNIDLDKLKTERVIKKNISDFGTAATKGKELWVAFSPEFKKQLNGKVPVVTFSTYDPTIALSIKEKNAEGFRVISSSEQPVTFDYVAMAVISIQMPEEAQPKEMMKNPDINAWYAEFAKRNKLVEPQKGHPAEEALERQKALEANWADPTVKDPNFVGPEKNDAEFKAINVKRMEAEKARVLIPADAPAKEGITEVKPKYY